MNCYFRCYLYIYGISGEDKSHIEIFNMGVSTADSVTNLYTKNIFLYVCNYGENIKYEHLSVFSYRN